MAMSLNIDALKRLNLVDFLTEHYGLQFRSIGNEYVCCSPFTAEEKPSFFVRLVDRHWLFKCFSSGHGGSIIDFVRIKENLHSLQEVVAHIAQRISSPFLRDDVSAIDDAEREVVCESGSERAYDILHLYERFSQADISICREYLLDRGIAESLVNELVAEGILVHNRYSGHSYCCFAVRSAQGELVCLDNHQIDGERKFVLGVKSIFSQDWQQLAKSETVFICESIIDYLSVKSLESSPPPGLALLGNQVNFDPTLLSNARSILAALDDDRGGYSAILDLQEQFCDKEMRIYDLEGHKDPNALLMAVRSGKKRKLSAKRKLELYREFQQADNRAALARQWGIDRSYMYEIVGECDKILLETFSSRSAGRKPAGKPSSLEDAWQRIEELQAQCEQTATECQRLYCRSEFLQLRLKWAEIEAAKLRGEAVDEEAGVKKKSHIKKKKKKRRCS
jgi:DNA primase